jgi:excinuclease ABC subunit A
VQHIQDVGVLSKQEAIIAEAILKEINSRLSFLTAVGLKYLSLDREAGTLAGGEAQRIRLASQIGTGLTGVLYILDEPTIGLHQRDNHRLIGTLQNLRDKGNTVIVVEHDRDLMLAADEIVDFGPGAGKHGGEVVAQGTPEEVMADKNSVTGTYLKRNSDVLRKNAPRLSEEERVLVGPDDVASRVQDRPKIQLVGAYEHNLKHVDVDFPLHTLTAITGLSGSGKSTLLYDTLYQHLLEQIDRKTDKKPGPIERITVPDEVRRVTLIDQTPIGKTPRSNPATYTKVFDYIRKIFANTREAQMRGYSPGRFSFNVKGGRCENCSGDGQIKIEMQFLADVYVKCDVCDGKRYNRETLEVRYNDKNIAQVLEMNVEEAYDFFQSHSTLRKKLKTMLDVGLGYIELGQPAPTLSGGEAQRVKLAKELSTRSHDHIVYLLDEPTTGLHFHDVQNLLNVLHKLVEQENTVIVIEHNMDIIKNADWLIDLGPEGGEYGGEVVATGTPENVAAAHEGTGSFTGKYLEEELTKLRK